MFPDPQDEPESPVVAYDDPKRAHRRSRLDDLTRRADEDGLYDVDADAYREALDGVRNP